MIGFYNYTVILTYIGMLCGFGGLMYISNGDLKMSLYMLLAAGFCDMFDGKVASTMKKRTKPAKRFGIQIDSLSDLICFGVLPAMIVFHCTGRDIIHGIIPGLYVLCALIRLAWFNVDEEERQEQQTGCREKYLGLPVTTMSLFLPLFVGAMCKLSLPLDKIAPWFMLAVAMAFITPFRMKKPGIFGIILMSLCGIATLVLVIFGVPA